MNVFSADWTLLFSQTMFAICIFLFFLTSVSLFVLFRYLGQTKQCLDAILKIEQILNNCEFIMSEKIHKPKESTPNELLTVLNDILKQVTDKDNY